MKNKLISVCMMYFMLLTNFAHAEQPAEKNPGNKKSHCVFPGSKKSAPAWVCDAPVKGYDVTVTGVGQPDTETTKDKHGLLYSGIVSALHQLAIISDKAPRSSVAGKFDVKTSNSEISMNVKFGIFIQLEIISIDTTVYDYLSPDKTVDSLAYSYDFAKFSCPETYSIVNYTRTSGRGKTVSPIHYSSEEGKRCDKENLLIALNNAGLDLIDTAKGPKGELYVLLGSKTIHDLNISFI